MAFTATFYNCGEDARKINKSLGTVVGTASCEPTGPVSSMTPTLICDYNGSIEGANFCSFGGKNYFITNIEKATGGKIIVQCKVDVLSTYATAINALPAIAKRVGSESYNLMSKYIVDPRQEFQAYHTIQTIVMGDLDPLGTTAGYILVTSG